MTEIERCPVCYDQLAQRTNGNGRAYLECDNCGHLEAIIPKADPHPTIRLACGKMSRSIPPRGRGMINTGRSKRKHRRRQRA